jgi:hypothetical protein
MARASAARGSGCMMPWTGQTQNVPTWLNGELQLGHFIFDPSGWLKW